MNFSWFSSHMLTRYCNSFGWARRHGVRKNFFSPQFLRASMTFSFSMASSSSFLCSCSFHSMTIFLLYTCKYCYMDIISLMRTSKFVKIWSITWDFWHKNGLFRWHNFFPRSHANGHALEYKIGRLGRLRARNPRQPSCPIFHIFSSRIWNWKL